MPKLTLDNSFRFSNQKENVPNFHSESIERLLQKLTSDGLRQFAGEEHIQAELKGWKKMLVEIKEVLDDAVKKQRRYESVNMWVGKLQMLAYDVEDLLDEFQTEAFQLQGKEANSEPSTSQFDSMAMCKVKEVNARLQDISSEIVVLGLKSSSVRPRLPLTSLLISAALRGRSRDPGPAISSPLFKKAKDLAFLEKEDELASSEKIGSSGGRDPGPAIFSPLFEKADLAFLEKEDGLASLEKIGSGGCGEVYKVELPGSNGKMIAIKKIVQPPKDAAELIEEEDELLNKKMSQIQSEITIAGQIRHKNILPLLAHIARPDCYLLVHEFMKNGSLQDIINDVSQGRRELDWLLRHRIALGVASGLEYLHFYNSPPIIHRDLRPANVLLDDDMRARIANFVLAKAVPDARKCTTMLDAHTCITTSNVVGKGEYTAPEYHQTKEITCRSDMYSFGVLLAVLVMGKLPSDDFFQHTEEMSLVKWMRNVMNSENPIRAIDSKLLGNGYEPQMLIVLKIACFCTLDNPKERPDSSSIRRMLSNFLL